MHPDEHGIFGKLHSSSIQLSVASVDSTDLTDRLNDLETRMQRAESFDNSVVGGRIQSARGPETAPTIHLPTWEGMVPFSHGWLGKCQWPVYIHIRAMTVTFEIPDEISDRLTAELGSPDRAALEALAAEADARAALTLEEVRRMLGLETRWEAQEILSRHAALAGQTADEVLQDATAAAAFRVPLK